MDPPWREKAIYLFAGQGLCSRVVWDVIKPPSQGFCINRTMADRIDDFSFCLRIYVRNPTPEIQTTDAPNTWRIGATTVKSPIGFEEEAWNRPDNWRDEC